MRQRFPVLMTALFFLGAVCSSPGAEPSTATLTLSLPELSWALEIPAPGFRLEEKQIATDGDAARLQAANEKTGITVSAFLEKAQNAGGSAACREFYWGSIKKTPVKVEQVVLGESGSVATVEFFIPEFRGVKVNQLNLDAFLAEREYWIHVHYSKTGFEAGQPDPLKPFLEGIQIRRAYTPTASDGFVFGSFYYRRRDYRRAIPFYEKALAAETQRPSLDRRAWIVLVDQLGMAYGISGDLAKAKQTFEWAITKEPQFPMFYYNLACAHAEMGNRDEALRNLRAAFQYKGNMLPGETFPDPREDSSFQKLLKDPAFAAEVNKMK